ncbi:MAG: hypothetical protein KF718_05695 [Polyangiaceae bacterium]|nr:hypothetical protein [Polyangiaceae bacterium]
MSQLYRIGVDENGLGARLGPLVVTAVGARLDERGERTLSRRLPRSIAADLDDSKRLVSHSSFSLGEAWARAVVPEPSGPAELFAALSLESAQALTAPCPRHVEAQCWSPAGQAFGASEADVERLRSHLSKLEARGVCVTTIRTSVVCTKRLNEANDVGHHRFVADLHAMERLVLELRREAGVEILAICGKVGGIADYGSYFGPLSERLFAVLEQGRARSAYRFPGVGELHFVRDADASCPLVMLASLVGKWVRELLMERVARFYLDASAGDRLPSGYNDPVTKRFIAVTAPHRQQLAVPDTCFMRDQANG